MLWLMCQLALAMMVAPLLLCLPRAWRGMKNDFLMIYKDPALEYSIETLFAYPGEIPVPYARIAALNLYPAVSDGILPCGGHMPHCVPKTIGALAT
jgi:hypothetical protein